MQHASMSEASGTIDRIGIDPIGPKHCTGRGMQDTTRHSTGWPKESAA